MQARIYLISSKGSVTVLSITAKEKKVIKKKIRGSEYINLRNLYIKNLCKQRKI